MKRIFFAVLLAACVFAVPLAALAQPEEPIIYVIKKGDTLWGLSDRFLKDPFYWPDLWARNPSISNPHLIYPGQKVKIYPDRIEIEPAPAAVAKGPRIAAPETEVAAERTFTVNGAEGFLAEKEPNPSGHIMVTNNDRQLNGADDVVYTDIGRAGGARTGGRYSIFQKMEAVSHPVKNYTVGYRVASLGTLQLVELKENNSKAIITRSFREIGPGSYLLPYRNRKREISLRAARKDFEGYIVSSRDGIITLGAGDIAYLDLGRKQGLEVGNLLYVVRDIKPSMHYTERKGGVLPKDVIGAVVIVETEENTSTALIVKSVEAIYRGDRVELKKY
jgi:LysM repeat protein